MKSCVIVFPGTNSERDVAVSLEAASGVKPDMVWHADTDLPETDLIVVPGGFAHGDYLRAGAMAARSHIMQAVVDKAKAGTPTLGICNGFQVLCEAGLLPGALMRNASLNFVCKPVDMRVEATDSPFTKGFEAGDYVSYVASHHDGNYFADDETLNRLEGEGRVAFRYVAGVNGAARNIAGVLNETGAILGLMPHPERATAPQNAGDDGTQFFKGIVEALG